MSNAKFTPGPWTVKDVPGAGLQIWAEVNIGAAEGGGVLQPIYRVALRPSLSVGEDGRVYMMLSYEDWRQFQSVAFDEMQKANARVMSASPAMYAELIYLRDWIESGCDMEKLAMGRVHAVIKKVEGL